MISTCRCLDIRISMTYQNIDIHANKKVLEFPQPIINCTLLSIAYQGINICIHIQYSGSFQDMINCTWYVGQTFNSISTTVYITEYLLYLRDQTTFCITNCSRNMHCLITSFKNNVWWLKYMMNTYKNLFNTSSRFR